MHEIGKWFTEGLQPGTVHCPIVMNGKDAYAKALPAEYQQLIAVDAKPVALRGAERSAYAEADAKWIPIYKERAWK